MITNYADNNEMIQHIIEGRTDSFTKSQVQGVRLFEIFPRQILSKENQIRAENIHINV